VGRVARLEIAERAPIEHRGVVGMLLEGLEDEALLVAPVEEDLDRILGGEHRGPVDDEEVAAVADPAGPAARRGLVPGAVPVHLPELVLAGDVDAVGGQHAAAAAAELVGHGGRDRPAGRQLAELEPFAAQHEGRVLHP
jgi:hypothetical protein